MAAWWTGLAAGAYAHTLVGFATAFVLGTVIGLERQWRQRTAGLRTNVLVAVGAAAFSALGMRLLGAEGAAIDLGLRSPAPQTAVVSVSASSSSSRLRIGMRRTTASA